MSEEPRGLPDAQEMIKRYEEHGFEPLRIESITEQLRQVSYSGCTEILEVGCVGRFLRHCCKLFPQIKWTTIDIAEGLSADYVGSVTDMPLEDDSFDLIVCCQVLEHLPFEDFSTALDEMHRVARKKVIMSLPDRTRHFGIAVRIARFGWYILDWNPPKWHDVRHRFRRTGQHYWEIGCKGSLARDVVRKIKNAGFAIEEQYRLWRHPWHRFFILKVGER